MENTCLDSQNSLGRPRSVVTKSAVFDAEARGSKCPVGSGWVATEADIRNRPHSKRAQEKIRHSGKPFTPMYCRRFI